MHPHGQEVAEAVGQLPDFIDAKSFCDLDTKRLSCAIIRLPAVWQGSGFRRLFFVQRRAGFLKKRRRLFLFWETVLRRDSLENEFLEENVFGVLGFWGKF